MAVDQLARAEQIEKRSDKLKIELQTRIASLKTAAEAANDEFKLDLKLVRDPRGIDRRYSDDEIHEIARNLQNELWRNRNDIWKDESVEHLIGVLDPADAFRVLGYHFETTKRLGKFADGSEVAGYINKQEKRAAVSCVFEPEVQRFTAAHELAHAVLHKENEQFRDREIDGGPSGSRTPVEYEADKFAAFFLMPENSVRTIFEQIFRRNRFVVDNATAFALGANNAAQLLRECPTVRQLSLRLASAEMYSSRPTRSIASVFGVSVGAMAIRLEELGLVELNGHQL